MFSLRQNSRPKKSAHDAPVTTKLYLPLNMKVVDLFCGCGGFSTGAKMAGHEVVLAIDSWDSALEAHAYNNPTTKHVLMKLGGDLNQCRDLIFSCVSEGSKWHLHGSPPCQNLSVANRANGNVSEGMRLVFWYLDLVKLCKPTSWSMEQVIGAAQYLHDYEISILNTADYLVPQTRKRLFIGEGWIAPKPLGEKSLADKLPYLRNEGNLIKGYKNTVAVKRDGVHLGNRKLRDLEGFKSIEEPTYTLCAAGPLKLYDYQHGGVPQFIRDLTIRECLTVQGFPTSYDFPPSMPKTTVYKLIGNAVSPPMAFLITKELHT